ncbi:MAG: DNA replication and repair protein RecF [bacterium]|nr:DNA replication and repair protein RecF [bacterium]
MYLRGVEFENFRNIRSLDQTFRQGFVVIVGENGSGKTNFLEGLYFGCSLRRFPESKFSQFFRVGENHFRLVIHSYAGEERRQELFCAKEDNRYKSRIKLNNQSVSRQTYSPITPVISFLPQDLNLLVRSPGDRRWFLDEALSNVFPKYRNAQISYNKALQQRNELWEMIRSRGADMSELGVWDESLAEFGSLISHYRGIFLTYMNEKIGAVLDKLSPELSHIEFIYARSGSDSKEVFLQNLHEVRPKEEALGTTVIGPHRDDFQANLGGTQIVGFISRGQMRGVTLALKIVERNFIEENMGGQPILLLDDVFSELDAKHQQKVVLFFGGLGQVFLTTTHLGEVLGVLPRDTQIFDVNAGVLAKKDV